MHASDRPGRIEYLYLTPEQGEATAEMDEAIDSLPPQTRLRCRTPEIRTVAGKQVAYYPHMDYDERTPPSEETADLMCRTNGIMCPVAATCFANGLVLSPDHGVWGGRTIVDGKDYHKKESTND